MKASDLKPGMCFSYGTTMHMIVSIVEVNDHPWMKGHVLEISYIETRPDNTSKFVSATYNSDCSGIYFAWIML